MWRDWKRKRTQKVCLDLTLGNCVCMLSCFSGVWLFMTPWTAAHQVHRILSMGFSRQEYWSGLPCSPPGDILKRKESEVAQSCPTLFDPVDCSPSGSFIHGILQARILEWVAISFSRRSSRPRDRTQVACIGGRHFKLWATREAPTRDQTCVS